MQGSMSRHQDFMQICILHLSGCGDESQQIILGLSGCKKGTKGTSLMKWGANVKIITVRL